MLSLDAKPIVSASLVHFILSELTHEFLLIKNKQTKRERKKNNLARFGLQIEIKSIDM